LADYLVSCTTGMEEFVAELLRRDVPGASILWVDAGLLCLSAGAAEGALERLAYTSNCFKVLRRCPPGTVDQAVTQLIREPDWTRAAREMVRSASRFRLVLSDENRTVAGDPRARAQLVRAIESGCHIRHAPRGGGVEFWVLRRRNGAVFFCIRLSRRRAAEKARIPGQLRPELAELLCEISEPCADDVFLDPFVGSGAIVVARVRRPYNIAFAFDIDEYKARAFRREAHELQRRKIARGGPIIARCEDARCMTSLEDGFVDRVVTDPPWGLFSGLPEGSADLYRDALREMVRVTKPGGVIVMLLGRTEKAEAIARVTQYGLELVQRLNILVSGKKAMVLKWRRAEREA